MADSQLYLRQNVQVEPLVNHWYAWAHLISPATAALSVANHHVKLLKSFVSAPKIHAAAVRNPAMLGGPFVDLDASRVAEAAALLRSTEQHQAPLLTLASALAELHDMLASEATGHSLEGLYQRLPEALQGYVELFYDLNGHAGFRLLEPLLYRSRFYDPSLQSVRFSISSSADQRPFVFSTPRLLSPGQFALDMAFADPRLDELMGLRSSPRTLSQIGTWLGLDGAQLDDLLPFLTAEAPLPAKQEAPGEGLQVRYLGHASLLFQTPEVSILLDPILGYDSTRGVCAADLPGRIDYVLLSHAHSDHVVIETLLQLRQRIGEIVVPKASGSLEDPSLRLMLNQIGFSRVREVEELDEISVAGGVIMSVPFFGEHGDLNIRTKTAYRLVLEGQRILCTADSANLDPRMYEHVHAACGDVDSIFLGMECDGAPLSWMYGALLMRRLERRMDQSRRLCASDEEQAWEVVRCFNPKRVFVYAMGQEEWLGYITSIRYTEASKPIVESNKLIARCQSQGIHAERLFGAQQVATV